MASIPSSPIGSSVPIADSLIGGKREAGSPVPSVGSQSPEKRPCAASFDGGSPRTPAVPSSGAGEAFEPPKTDWRGFRDNAPISEFLGELKDVVDNLCSLDNVQILLRPLFSENQGVFSQISGIVSKFAFSQFEVDGCLSRDQLEKAKTAVLEQLESVDEKLKVLFKETVGFDFNVNSSELLERVTEECKKNVSVVMGFQIIFNELLEKKEALIDIGFEVNAGGGITTVLKNRQVPRQMVAPIPFAIVPDSPKTPAAAKVMSAEEAERFVSRVNENTEALDALEVVLLKVQEEGASDQKSRLESIEAQFSAIQEDFGVLQAQVVALPGEYRGRVVEMFAQSEKKLAQSARKVGAMSRETVEEDGLAKRNV